MYPEATSASFWIGTPGGNNKTEYYLLDGTKDGMGMTQMVAKNLTSGQCITANMGQTTGNHIIIDDTSSCTTVKSYACETGKADFICFF